MEQIQSLISWAKTNGAEISENIEFVKFQDNNFGAQSSSEPATIKIPASIIFKLSNAVKGFDFDCSGLIKSTKNINAFLKLFLARERSPNYAKASVFTPYISTLPSSIQINSPYVWLAEDQQFLQGTNLGNSLKGNISALVEEWWLVISLLPESCDKPEGHFMNLKFYYEYKFYEPEQLCQFLINDDPYNWTSFSAYMWALMIFKSRSFPSSLLKDSPETDPLDVIQEDVAILIPGIDLLNHNPQADVTWSVKNGSFVFESNSHSSGELYNNYGRKGNEELLLAYGFCLSDNSADTVALRMKVPPEMLPRLVENGVQLPKMSDYTTSVVNSGETETKDNLEEYKDGLLFFISKDRVPDSLVQVFQWMVQSPWETFSLRMELSGLNYLRLAIESKIGLISLDGLSKSLNEQTLKLYLSGQKKVLQGAVSQIKHMENSLLTENKSRILSLKTVYKNDKKFAQSLMVTMGVTSYKDILEQELMDQIWLLYLIRCFNRDEYHGEDPDEQYLPEWITKCFIRMDEEVSEISSAEIVQFRELYENLILPMNKAAPEIYNVGKWTVRELVLSSRVMDIIGFVRGKKQECLLVDDFSRP